MSALFKVYRGKAEKMPVEMHDGYAYFTTDTGKFYIDAIVDGRLRRTLINPDERPGAILSNTKEGWDSQPSLIGEQNVIYIYTNYKVDQQGHILPGMKIGDGNAFLIDAPFIDTDYAVVSTSANGIAPKIINTSGYLKGDGTWAIPTNTTYANASTQEAGLLPQLEGGTAKYLRADGTWQTPPDNNTTYTISMASNVITLTDSSGGTSTISLPIYNGGVT